LCDPLVPASLDRRQLLIIPPPFYS